MRRGTPLELLPGIPSNRQHSPQLAIRREDVK